MPNAHSVVPGEKENPRTVKDFRMAVLLGLIDQMHVAGEDENLRVARLKMDKMLEGGIR